MEGVEEMTLLEQMYQELLRQSKDVKCWDRFDNYIYIFIHHPFEKWNTHKQEEKLVIIEANLPIAVLYSSQILFAHLSINMLLLSTMLNGIHL